MFRQCLADEYGRHNTRVILNVSFLLLDRSKRLWTKGGGGFVFLFAIAGGPGTAFALVFKAMTQLANEVEHHWGASFQSAYAPFAWAIHLVL